MNNTLEPLPIVSTEIRYVKTEWGEDKEVLSTRKCCVCAERLWVTDNFGRQTTMPYSFNVLHPGAYLNGVPDYIKISNILLHCHYTCQKNLVGQLAAGTFIPR
jgi:hypothetical protein